MKLAPDITSRVLLGEEGIPCPVCHWPLQVWSRTAFFKPPVVTCWTEGCGVHVDATHVRGIGRPARMRRTASGLVAHRSNRTR